MSDTGVLVFLILCLIWRGDKFHLKANMLLENVVGKIEKSEKLTLKISN